MRIMVTGGAGLVGRGVIARLLRNGHEVRAVDWKADPQPQAGAQYATCDVTRFDEVREQVRGMQGIVHLAAYTHPAAAAGHDIYRVNTVGTFNIFEAAAQEGIRRVTVASSINALGYNFGVRAFPIEYLPMDEAHPTCTSDAYSFSKQTTEAIADYHWRRDGISSTCLRLPGVYSPDGRVYWTRSFVEMRWRAIAKLAAAPPEQQRDWLERIRAGLAEARRDRLFEVPWEQRLRGGPPDEVILAGLGHTDFWAVIDVDDAAQAFEKSLLADFEGSHALFVSQRENLAGVESETLARLFYPQVTARRRAIPGRQTLLSYDRAAQLIGYEPQHLVRDRIPA